MSRWPNVVLGEVLIQQRRDEAVQPDREYRVLGAHWYAKGLYVKDEKSGTEIRSGKLYRVHAGDFVYNRLFAWKGSFAVASDDVDGCYVSSEFPCFAVDAERLVPEYLWLYFSREDAWDKALGLSFGATPTSRNRLNEARFLAMKMPLPPIEEQRRVVRRIEQLATPVERVKRLARIATTISGVAYRSVFDAAIKTESRVVPLGEIATKITKGTTPKTYGFSFANEGVPFLRAEEVGGGLVEWQQTPFFLPPEANQFMSRSRTQAGDVLVTIAGTIGRSAVVPVEAPQLNVNQAVAVVRLAAGVLPEYLSAFVRSPQGQDYLVGRTVQSAISNISLKTLRQMPVPVPSMDQQHRIVERVQRLGNATNGVARRREVVVRELSALLASALQRAML